MTEQNGVSYEQVYNAATTMHANGITPTVRKIMAVTGGRTETVSELLRDYNDKRFAEVQKMSDEIGSSAIAKLLASEIQVVVERKTEQLRSLLLEVKEQRDELVDLISEHEKSSSHRIEMAELRATQAINDANLRASKAEERADHASIKTSEILKASEVSNLDAQEAIKNAELKSDLLVSNAKSEAQSLINAANLRADKAEQEAATLREQVKSLSIEQAKREIEQVQLQQTLGSHQLISQALSDEKTRNARLQTQHENFLTDIQRLENEIKELKSDSKQLALLQGQHIELQKQFTQIQQALSQSERERESLTMAIRSQRNS